MTDQQDRDRLDRALGCFVGLAVGDALGAPLEFSQRDSLPAVDGYRSGGPFDLDAGDFTDDTSCSLALADSLLSGGGRFYAEDFLTRLSRWYNEGLYSVKGRCFDIGNQTRTAITSFQRDGTKVHGKLGSLQGNGSIMRLAASAVCAVSEEDACLIAVAQSRTTHANSRCIDACRGMAGALWSEIEGNQCRNPGLVSLKRKQIKSTGHVVETLRAALWAVETTTSFRDAVLLAANLGDDSDTVAAVTGQFAGARYGLSGIPSEWVRDLAWSGIIVETAKQLYDLRGA